MKTAEFLRALDNKLVKQYHMVNPSLMLVFIHVVLSYLSGERKNLSLQNLSDYADSLKGDIEQEEMEISWCGVNQGPYGFAIKTSTLYIMSDNEIAEEAGEMLYRYDEEGNEVMEEDEAKERAYEELTISDIYQIVSEYSSVEQMLDDDNLISVIDMWHYDAFAYANNDTEYCSLMEILLCKCRDSANEIGNRQWNVVTIKSPALNAWEIYLLAKDVDAEDQQRYFLLRSNLEKMEVTYPTSSDHWEFSSYSTGGDKSDGWYRTVFEDHYTQYYDANKPTGVFFLCGLISLKYLAIMLDMQEFLAQMDAKYHYLVSGSNATTAA